MECYCKRNFALSAFLVFLVSFLSPIVYANNMDIFLSYIRSHLGEMLALSIGAAVAFAGACYITFHYRMENNVWWALAFFLLLYLLSFWDYFLNLGWAVELKGMAETAVRLFSLAFSAPLATALIRRALRDVKTAGGLLLGILNLSVSCLSCSLLPFASLLAPILSFTAVLPYEGGELALLSAFLLLVITVYEGRKGLDKATHFSVKLKKGEGSGNG